MRLHAIPFFAACALIALLAASIAPAQDQARAPLVVTTPASVAAPVDTAAAVAPSTIAGIAGPAAVGAGDFRRLAITLPGRPAAWPLHRAGGAAA
jgi:hypothetical protein